MSKSDLISASADPTDPDGAADEADRMADAVERAALRLKQVQEITAVGMTLLRDVGERVAAAATAPTGEKAEGEGPPADAAGDFAKISRALRLTLDLEARFDEALRALQAGKAVALKERRESRLRRDADAERERREARREKVIAQVSIAIAIARESESEAGDSERSEALEERLDKDEAYGELIDRPLREVVGQLCADIGLAFDPAGWRENGWPEPPISGPGARSRWSPFRTASPRPIMIAYPDDPEAGSGLARPPP